MGRGRDFKKNMWYNGGRFLILTRNDPLFPKVQRCDVLNYNTYGEMEIHKTKVKHNI